MTNSLADRRFVYERAEDCCEYCRLGLRSGRIPFQIDHIIPIKHEGSNEVENLCLACYQCNAHKSHDLTGFDPATGEITRLYNPRSDTWFEHFEIQADMQIRGITPKGRTTARVLQMNTAERIESRQVLAEIDEYPC